MLLFVYWKMCYSQNIKGNNMPEDFKNAVKQGARVRTKKLGKDKYIHVAFLDGKTYAGKVKDKKTDPPGTKRKK